MDSLAWPSAPALHLTGALQMLEVKWPLEVVNGEPLYAATPSA
jgi:hypothetical protein